MTRHQSPAVILVGKSFLHREGLARILRSANFRVVASVSCADDLLPGKIQPNEPLFLIVHAGSDFDVTVEQIEIFRSRCPGGRIAIVADHNRLEELVLAFRAGANGYLVDVMTSEVFIKSIELVMMGGTVFPPAFPSFAFDPEGHLDEPDSRDENDHAIFVTTAEDAIVPELSPRENSVLRCLIDGNSNKSIARKIDISEATVKVHIKAILRKIRVQNRTQAAIWGMNRRSLERTANNKPPLSTFVVNKQPPSFVREIPEIKLIDAVVPLAVNDHETIQSKVPRPDRLVRKLEP